MNIQTLLIENSYRPVTQDQIREAAIKGASRAGYNLILGYDNQPKAGTRETYDNWEDCLEAAIEQVKEDVNLD